MPKAARTSSVVVDSCVWIDLANANVLADVFCLPYQLVDPDLMTQEKIQPANWRKLVNLGLTLLTATAEQVLDISSIQHTNPGLSFFDAAALELARRERYMLLTDDGYLKKTAVKYQVNVGGITWLLNEMVENACMTGTSAFDALNKIHQNGHAMKISEINAWKMRWIKNSL